MKCYIFSVHSGESLSASLLTFIVSALSRQLKAVASGFDIWILRGKEMRTLWMQMRALHELPFRQRNKRMTSWRALPCRFKPTSVGETVRLRLIKDKSMARWNPSRQCNIKDTWSIKTKRNIWHDTHADSMYLLTHAKTNKHTYIRWLSRGREVTLLLTADFAGRRMCHRRAVLILINHWED